MPTLLESKTNQDWRKSTLLSTARMRRLVFECAGREWLPWWADAARVPGEFRGAARPRIHLTRYARISGTRLVPGAPSSYCRYELSVGKRQSHSTELLVNSMPK